MGTFYEFFCGGGMARSGLSPEWDCLFANDYDHKKCRTYIENWGPDEIHRADVRDIRAEDLPGHPDLVWGSFPCQDLSLAGAGAGLKGNRSGTFWPFWQLIDQLRSGGRKPPIVALENVCGTLSSNGGRDFQEICKTFYESGYRFGAVVVNASLFLPQSRPRLFILGICDSIEVPNNLESWSSSQKWHTQALVRSVAKLPKKFREKWIWWDLPFPSRRNSSLVDVIEAEPNSVVWHSKEDTKRLLGMMDANNLRKVEDAIIESSRRESLVVGSLYKRTRRDKAGQKVQRAEVRFDDIAGCLRTPMGGSSRQVLLLIEKGEVRSRLISSRETARLMGLPDTYDLPDNYNEAYHLTGDGVAVPVVRFLAENLFNPILNEVSSALSEVAA